MLREKLKQVRRQVESTARVVRDSAFLGELSRGGLRAVAREALSMPRGPAAMLRVHAVLGPTREALVELATGTRWTYADFEERINQLAHVLASVGVTSGSRVAIMLHNSVDCFVAQWATVRAGATAVLVGYRSTAAEVQYLLENSKPDAFLVHEELAAVASEARDGAGAPTADAFLVVPGDVEARVARLRRLGGEQLDRPPRRRPTAAGGVMIYTSGTTGRPKGATRGFETSRHSAVLDFMSQVGVRGEDRHLVVAPLYHSAAPAVAAMVQMVGGTNFVMRHFDPEETLAVVEREGITSIYMAPTMIARIMALPAATLARYRTSTVRWVAATSAPLPTPLAAAFQERFGQVLFNFYGATETGLVTLAGPADHLARPGTIGRPLLGNELRLLDASGREVPTGEVGEVWVKSSMLVSGYHGNAKATADAMRDGFFSVGDLGYVDADGYLYLADRKHDMVISGGVNIYPLEIEQRLFEHPAVAEAAVVGVPHPEWGESLKAYVVRRADGAGVSAAELEAHCRKTLSGFKVPRAFVFVDELPRNPTGKVLKRELRARG